MIIPQIRLFGRAQVEHSGAAWSRKAYALLSYLVRHPQPLTRTHLTDLLWGETSETRGRRNLTRELGLITAALPGCLQCDHQTLHWQPGQAAWVDTSAFVQLLAGPVPRCAGDTPTGQLAPSDVWFGQHAVAGIDADRLAAAVGLYQGEFMAELFLDDCPEFEAWLTQEREYWRRLVTTTLDQLVGFYALRHADVLAEALARRWLALDSAHEGAHRALMVLLARNAQRGAALAQYDACRRALRAELNIEPAAATAALDQQIRAGAFERELVGTGGPATHQRRRIAALACRK